jgi:hypothetical protein
VSDDPAASTGPVRPCEPAGPSPDNRAGNLRPHQPREVSLAAPLLGTPIRYRSRTLRSSSLPRRNGWLVGRALRPFLVSNRWIRSSDWILRPFPHPSSGFWWSFGFPNYDRLRPTPIKVKGLARNPYVIRRISCPFPSNQQDVHRSSPVEDVATRVGVEVSRPPVCRSGRLRTAFSTCG